MLKPDDFNNKADVMISLYQQLEDYIMQDIAHRLLKSQGISGTADRMAWKLQQMGLHQEMIMSKLKRLTNLTEKELKELLKDAVLTSYNDDLDTLNTLGIEVTAPLENKAVMDIMNAEYIKSLGELNNLTRTTMNKSQADLIRLLDEVEFRTANGVQSYTSAVCDVLDNYAGRGIMVQYPTGTELTLETATRLCVVTSMNQTSAQVTNQYIVEGGLEYVLVSAHLGARPQGKGPYCAGHENWQGKIYKINGSEDGYPNLAEMTGYNIDSTGIGTVINPLGLHGYNCRHSHKPWDKSLRNPYENNPIDTEENRKVYQTNQQQRKYERDIRKTKRELLMKQAEINGVAETDIKNILQKDYDKLAYELREKNKAYNFFCEKNDLQKQYDRIKVAGFKREQSSAANGRATAYQKQISTSIGE